MTETRSPFEHSTPELYDRYMGPLLFEPYAKVVAGRAALVPAGGFTDLQVETRDTAHAERVLSRLRERGYRVTEPR